jgi:hypothetical protein
MSVTAPATSSKRAPYGFKLDFPTNDFTMRDLRKQKSHKVKYITLYMRVKNALKDGTLIVAGEKAPSKVRRGRKELVFRRVDAKTNFVTVTPVS